MQESQVVGHGLLRGGLNLYIEGIPSVCVL